MFFFSENYFSKLPRQVQAHLTRGNLRVFSSEFAQLAQLHVAVISLKFNVTRVLVEVVKRCQLHVNFHKPDTNNIKFKQMLSC